MKGLEYMEEVEEEGLVEGQKDLDSIETLAGLESEEVEKMEEVEEEGLGVEGKDLDLIEDLVRTLM